MAIMQDDLDMINLCSQLKRVGIDLDVAQISLNRHPKEQLDKIKSTFQNLLQLVRSGSDYLLQNNDDGKDEVSEHKIESLFRCKERNQVSTTRADALKHPEDTRGQSCPRSLESQIHYRLFQFVVNLRKTF